MIHYSIQIHGFARWIHVYTIPWYNSGNLKNKYLPWIIRREKDQFPATNPMSSGVDQLSKMSSLSSFANSGNEWNWKKSVQWKPINVITLGLRESDNNKQWPTATKYLLLVIWDLINLEQFYDSNQMITLSVITLSSLNCISKKLLQLDHE